jgi:hypothetical protein
MFNPNVFEYMNYQFGDKVDEDYVYVGIYNNNILLININEIFLFGYDRPFPTRVFIFRLSPTVNELKYIYNNLFNLSKQQRFIPVYLIPIMGLNIKDFITINNIYYNPKTPRFMLMIKRIPIQ